jgi:hypothetical protein
VQPEEQNGNDEGDGFAHSNQYIRRMTPPMKRWENTMVSSSTANDCERVVLPQTNRSIGRGLQNREASGSAAYLCESMNVAAVPGEAILLGKISPDRLRVETIEPHHLIASRSIPGDRIAASQRRNPQVDRTPGKAHLHGIRVVVRIIVLLAAQVPARCRLRGHLAKWFEQTCPRGRLSRTSAQA